MNQEQAINFISGSIGKYLLEGMMSYVTSITWGRFNDGIYEVFSSGTAFILNLGQGPFLVTAAHVYEGYLEAKEREIFFRSTLGDLEFDFEKNLRCTLGSKALDIAIFSISDLQIRQLGKQVAYANTDHISQPVNEFDGVILCGFPGIERAQLGNQEYEFGLYVALTPVSSSSHRHFGCVFNRGSWIDTIGKGLPAAGYDLGGMSGGPAFRFKESPAGIVSWEFSGVIYDATNSLGEIILIHHANFIMPDGKLNSPLT